MSDVYLVYLVDFLRLGDPSVELHMQSGNSSDGFFPKPRAEMSDPELEAIRRARLAELRASGGGTWTKVMS